MSLRAMRSALAPWAGLFLGALAWFGSQQTGSNAIYWACDLGEPTWSIVVCGVAAAVAVFGGVVSWRSRRGAQGDGAGVRRFAGLLGAATAGIFLLAIVFQALAGLIVPACGS